MCSVARSLKLELCVINDPIGKDATSAFLSIGHSESAIETREKFLIGTVKPSSSEDRARDG